MPIFEGQPQSVIYDSTIGYLTDANGNPITLETVTYAQFIAGDFDLATARHVFVSDKHSTRNATATPGSLWRIDPTGGVGYKRLLVSGPIYAATLDAAIDPVDYPGIESYIASFDGDVVSNGTAYEPKDQYVVLKNIAADLSRLTDLETEWYPISLEIPRDVNGKSLLRQNGYIQFHSIWWNKTGTTDNLRAIVRMGTANSSADLAIVDVSNTPVTRWARDVELKRTGNTTIQFRGDGSTTFNSGGSAATHSTDLTINNMDTTPTYINVGGRLTKTGGSLVDTALYIKECEIRLFKAGQSGPQLKWSQLYDYLVSFPDPPTGSGNFYTSQLDAYADVDSLAHAPRRLATAMGGTDGYINVRTEFGLAAGDVVLGNATDVDAVFTRTIAANDMIGGKGNKVVLEQLKRTPTKWNAETPQVWAMLGYRYEVTTAVPPLCYQFTVKVPSNLSDILTHTDPLVYTGWFEFFALKDGASNATMYHRYGLVFEKQPGETGMRFAVRFDLFRRDLSNNVISNDTPTALWRMESDEGSLEDGKQYTIYFYVDQKLDYTDLSGVTSIVIINDTDQTVAMSDSVTGVPTCGYAKTPIVRPIFHGIYTGGFPSSGTIVIAYGNTFIWDRMPVVI